MQGKVIDFWRHRIPKVEVFIGGASTTTDDSGLFTIANVVPPYDVGLAVRVADESEAWVFQGLNHATPTLQVVHGAVPDAPQQTLAFENVPDPSPTDGGLAEQSLTVAFGSPDSAYSCALNAEYPQDTTCDFDWEGPPGTTGTGHALLWETTPTDFNWGEPLRYVSYDEQMLTLDATAGKTLTFDIAREDISAANVTGTISPAASDCSSAPTFDSRAELSFRSYR